MYTTERALAEHGAKLSDAERRAVAAARTPATVRVELRLTSEELAAAAAARPRRLLRLRRDLGVNLTGTAIIVDLLERLDRVEAELIRLRTTR